MTDETLDEPTNADSSCRHQETMSIAEAAAFIRIGVDALRELILAGQIPALTLNQKHWVLLRSDLVEFVRNIARQQQLHRRSLVAESEIMKFPADPPPRRTRQRLSITDVDA